MKHAIYGRSAIADSFHAGTIEFEITDQNFSVDLVILRYQNADAV